MFVLCAAVVVLTALLVTVATDPARPVAVARTADLSSLRLEIADTDATRTRGLSGRPSLDERAGMLFVFPERGVYPFWMKEMRFPIDIVWIDGDTVVDVVTLPPPEEGRNVPPSHIPLVKADLVLEVNAGQAAALGLVKDAKVVLPR